MAGQEEAVNGTGGAGGEEEDGKMGKGAGEEEVKKRRGRPPKTKVGGKGEEKSVGSLRKYLEVTKNEAENESIVKGKELQRTPVKQASKGESAAEEKKSARAEEDEMAAVEQQEKERTGEESSEAEEEDDERVRSGVVSVDANAAMYEWMDEWGEIVRRTEARLEQVIGSVKAKDDEVEALKEEFRCRDIVVEGLERRITGMKAIIDSYRSRIEDLEKWREEGIAKEKRVRAVSVEEGGVAGVGGGEGGGVSVQMNGTELQSERASEGNGRAR